MMPAPKTCPECGSKEIQPFGIGTQKVEEEIRAKFPQASLIRMDSDSTGYKNSHMAILDKFKNEGIDILIGTQMIAKGHDFPNITLVGILAADTLLAGYDYDSQERAFQLIVQASGRAGRGDKPGKAIIQAYNTDAYALQFGVKQDYAAFYEAETRLRKKLGYPPFGMLARIIISSADRNEGKKWAEYIRKALDVAGMEVSSASYAPVSRIMGKYRFRVVAKASDERLLRKTVNDAYLGFTAKKHPAVTCSIDIAGGGML
jgi:primosomal protein N' (replication factor Y)